MGHAQEPPERPDSICREHSPPRHATSEAVQACPIAMWQAQGVPSPFDSDRQSGFLREDTSLGTSRAVSVPSWLPD
jgi:hypothetical protein